MAHDGGQCVRCRMQRIKHDWTWMYLNGEILCPGCYWARISEKLKKKETQ